jgi:hypothetical protein
METSDMSGDTLAGDTQSDGGQEAAGVGADWPGRPEAMQRLKRSLSSIHRLERQGRLKPIRVNGQLRYDPTELEDLALAMEGESTDDAGTHTLVMAANAQTRQAQGHVEKLIALLTAPANRLLEQVTAEAGELRKRIGELEQKHTALLEAAQASLDRGHERQLREQEQQAKLALKFEALAALKQWAPMLVSRVMNKRGEKKTATQVLTESLVSSLTEDQVVKIFQSGIFSDAQGATLMAIMQNLAMREATAAPQAPTTPGGTDSTNGVADPGEGKAQ